MYETNRDYHADREHVSNSMLGIYIESPEKYRQTFITQTLAREVSKQMRLGTLTHILTLTPDHLEEEVVVVEASTRNTNKYKDAVKRAMRWLNRSMQAISENQWSR